MHDVLFVLLLVSGVYLFFLGVYLIYTTERHSPADALRGIVFSVVGIITVVSTLVSQQDTQPVGKNVSGYSRPVIHATVSNAQDFAAMVNLGWNCHWTIIKNEAECSY